jgi:hypothetical protein
MDEAVIQKLKDGCSVKVPGLRVEDQYSTTRKIKVDVRNEVGRLFLDRSKPIMEDATEVTVHIPFEGDPLIFDVAPSASNSTAVVGEIVDQELRLVMPLMRTDFDLPASVNREVSQINWRPDQLRFNADTFNSNLEHDFKAYTTARRKKMVEHDSIVSNLGIPVRQAAAPSPAESGQSVSKPETAREAWNLSKSASGAPRALLSYSWEVPEHKRWVTELAERLQGVSGVEIIFDLWRPNPGDDKLHFMEQAVAKSDFVIVVCTPTYAERANNREGGVGYESMDITSELAEHIRANKFIPVLRKGSWTSSLPTYLKSRIGVNLSDEPYSEDEYERLLRVLHGEPVQPPPIGNKPDFSKKPTSSVEGSRIPDTTKTVLDKASSGVLTGTRVDLGAGLLAIGPEVICIGDIEEVSGATWTLRLGHFVTGNVHELIAFIGQFAQTATQDRYVLSNKLGDGRVLSNTPTLTKQNDGYSLLCPV